MRAKKLLLAVAAALLLCLCGCSMQTSDLFCLPQRSDRFTKLQTAMQEAMEDLSYSAPVSGVNQQTVQTADLDGDGELEYLLFARRSGDKPLRILVLDGVDGEYVQVAAIDCSGSTFDQVEYIQMDGRPGLELVVGRQVSDQVLRSVSVYSMVDGQMEQIIYASYTQYLTCDLDKDGKVELFLLRPGENNRGMAVMYRMDGHTPERSVEVDMSAPAENARRLVQGKLQDGNAAVYVSSTVNNGEQDGTVTDVFALRDGTLTNVAPAGSVQTLRNFYIYADDIDGDGILELPSLIAPKTEVGTDSQQYTIRWYALDTQGTETDKTYTYHNFMGGWYMELDSFLADQVLVSQKGNGFEFSLWDSASRRSELLFSVYVLTGQRREEQAVSDNRFVLYRDTGVIYAARLEVAASNYNLTSDSLIGAFHLIQEDWNKGDV